MELHTLLIISFYFFIPVIQQIWGIMYKDRSYVILYNLVWRKIELFNHIRNKPLYSLKRILVRIFAKRITYYAFQRLFYNASELAFTNINNVFHLKLQKFIKCLVIKEVLIFKGLCYLLPICISINIISRNNILSLFFSIIVVFC